MAAIAVATLTLIALFRNSDYNKGVVGAAVWFVLGVGYYAVWARHRLVLSPEEQTAIALALQNNHRRSRDK
jgi:ethanolamine permease